jgi:SAM-dependent methyltransferase
VSKESVKVFWDEAACGEELLLPSYDLEGYAVQASERYRLEPYISSFAEFEKSSGLAVLEVGLGLGADHENFALAGAKLTGIDLTPRAVKITGHRLALRSLETDLLVGDAEDLPYDTGTFDCVYSWGVIHHTPNTHKAAKEILRVLKPGGKFRVMVYHTWSLVGLMLWARYGLLRGRPWVGLEEIYSKWLESPGTKSYSKAQAASLFDGATEVVCRVELTHGDLLESGAGQRHGGVALDLARRFWPRWLLRRVAKRFGLFLLISGRKVV